MAKDPVATLKAAWDRLSPMPGGAWLFSQLFGLLVPYSGTIGLRIQALRPGYAKAAFKERWRVRNHLNSIHAIAIANAGEAVSGLAMSLALPKGARAIVTGLRIEYLKKARGRLTIESETVAPPLADTDLEHEVVAILRDASQDEVARVIATWRIGKRPDASVATAPAA